MRTRHRTTPPIFRYSPIVAAVLMALSPQAATAAQTKTVTTAADLVYDPEFESFIAAPGSLRFWIEYFNGYTDDIQNCSNSGDRINFSGPFTIALSEQLPDIQCKGLAIEGPRGGGVKIVGNSSMNCGLRAQSYYFDIQATNLEIYDFSDGAAICDNVDSIDNNLHDNQYGIYANDNGVRIEGNTITANSYGIYLYNSYGGSISGNTIEDNNTGIYFTSTNRDIVTNTMNGNWNAINLCSSTSIVDRNTINGPGVESIGIDVCLSNATITGNTITNSDYGIRASDYTNLAASGNTITGHQIGIQFESFAYGSVGKSIVVSGRTFAGNDISDNTYSGIDVDRTALEAFTTGLSITGNTITRTSSGGGISVMCSTGVSITNNTIGGNDGPGVELWGVVGTQFGVAGGGAVEISGNRIGVAGDGVSALPNNSYGLYLGYSGCYGGPVGSGPTRGVLVQDNIIANNLEDGIAIPYGTNNNISGGNEITANAGRGVFITTGTGNEIVENLIYDNGGKAIDLWGSMTDPRLNDPGDADTGPNNGQNHPENITATPRPSFNDTVVEYQLDSLPGTYRIDLYSNNSAMPGGRVWHASDFYSGGIGTFVIPGTSADNFSLTATSDAHDTSEFSPTVTLSPAPAVTVIPSGWNFGNVAVNDVSPEKVITIRSTGSADYVINSISEVCYGGAICYGGPGAFIWSTTCRTLDDDETYDPGETCNVSAKFNPASTGHYAMTIRFSDNTDVGRHDILLLGDGVVAAPVTITPSAWDFGSVLVGRESAVKGFTIANPGSTPVSIGAVRTTLDFLLKDTTCAGSIPPGESCDANVTFIPGQQGPRNGSLTVESAPPTETFRGKGGRLKSAATTSAALSGLGISEAQLAMPESIDMGSYVLGTTPLQRTVQLENKGNTGLQIASISINAPFTVANGCPPILQPGFVCSVVLGFSTPTLGTFNGILSLVTSSTTGTGRVPVTARTVATAQPELRLSAATIGFGNRLFGTTSATQRVTITNIGTSVATIVSVASSSTDFLVEGTTCGVTLAPAATCTADVAMRPVGFGPRTGQLVVASDGVGSPQAVNLVGTGCRPYTGNANRTGASNSCAP